MYHDPVMLKEAIDQLVSNEAGCYVDLTFGGGGYSKEILVRLTSDGKLFSFDQDEDAVKNADSIDSESFQFVASNFRHLKRFLKLYGVKAVDGVVADLGVSSHQFDEGERGFSFLKPGPLDMRMNQSSEQTAADIVNTYKVSDLVHIFSFYGEVKNSKTLANEIVRARSESPITTTEKFIEIIEPVAPRTKEYRYYAQVFQALRIEVNEELKALEDVLLQLPEVVKPGGKVVMVSYHSLEDRLVKAFFQKGRFKGQVEKDIYGNELKPFAANPRKALVPTQEEVDRNKRARSAKMRVAIRTEQEWLTIS